MKRALAAVLLVGVLSDPGGVSAEETRTWTSGEAFSGTDLWWSLQLEERIAIGTLQTALFSSTSGINFGVGLMPAVHFDHHWYLGLALAVDFPMTGDIASTYTAVNASFSNIDAAFAVRLGYTPLALSWMTLGLEAEVGLVIDSTTVEAGGGSADALAAVPGAGGYAHLSFYPHDAFEIGLRAGYRYLFTDRASLSQADADRIHVPAGPYRAGGDIVILLTQVLHF